MPTLDYVKGVKTGPVYGVVKATNDTSSALANAAKAASIGAGYQAINQPGNPVGKQTISGGSSGASSGGSVSGNGGNLDNIYNSMMDDYRAMLEAQEAQRRAEYENAKNQLASAYERGKSNLNQNADDAYRQAYITYMNKRKGLNQQLANAGINGGAAESSIASLFNNYGSDRAGIAKEQLSALGDLEADYNTNLGNLSANYGSDYTNILNDYYGNVANLKASYAQDLAKLLQNSRNTQSASVTPSTSESDAVEKALASVSNLGKNLNADDEVSASSTPTGSNLLASTPGASAMLRNFQNKMAQGDEKSAYDLLNNLLAQGYSRAFINALIEASGY